MRNKANPTTEASPSSSAGSPDFAQEWQGFAPRLSQVLAHAGLTQTDLARQLGLSPGFLSEIARGIKRPGPDFFMGMRSLLGISIDWLMTGEGSMTGGVGIRHELFQAIRLQIAVAKAAVNDRDPIAKALLILIREGRLEAASADEDFAQLLERVAPNDAELDLAVELYNGHLWAADPIAQRRNLLAAAVAHFETRKPIDKLAAMTGAQAADQASSSPSVKVSRVQINVGKNQRVAGKHFIDLTSGKPPKT